MKTTHLDLDFCPNCGYGMNACSSAFEEDVEPKEGDITLCLKCGQILLFDDKLKVRYPKMGELDCVEASEFTRIKYIQAKIRVMQGERK